MKQPEEILHRQVVAYLNAAAPDCLFYHPPNGGGRSKAEAGILKAMGVRAGVADLAFVLADGKAAFIELKAEDGRQTPAQASFEFDCRQRRAPYAICRSLAEVQGVLDAWGVTRRGGIAA